jgi:hypothetical protein
MKDRFVPVQHLPVGGFEQPQYQSAGGRLAAAAFSGQAQDLALPDKKGDIVHGPHHPLILAKKVRQKPLVKREVFCQIFDLNQFVHNHSFGRRLFYLTGIYSPKLLLLMSMGFRCRVSGVSVPASPLAIKTASQIEKETS